MTLQDQYDDLKDELRTVIREMYSGTLNVKRTQQAERKVVILRREIATVHEDMNGGVNDWRCNECGEVHSEDEEETDGMCGWCFDEKMNEVELDS